MIETISFIMDNIRGLISEEIVELVGLVVIVFLFSIIINKPKSGGRFKTY
ncbi:Uncharacterised protein [uncultured archaeon]|nr:Uncharacterised protein [uncultured archaeon]